MVFLPPKKNCKNNRRLSLHSNLHNLYSSICTFFIHVASNYQNTQFLLLSSSQKTRMAKRAIRIPLVEKLTDFQCRFRFSKEILKKAKNATKAKTLDSLRRTSRSLRVFGVCSEDWQVASRNVKIFCPSLIFQGCSETIKMSRNSCLHSQRLFGRLSVQT